MCVYGLSMDCGEHVMLLAFRRMTYLEALDVINRLGLRCDFKKVITALGRSGTWPSRFIRYLHVFTTLPKATCGKKALAYHSVPSEHTPSQQQV